MELVTLAVGSGYGFSTWLLEQRAGLGIPSVWNPHFRVALIRRLPLQGP